jgi:hypothetical protein
MSELERKVDVLITELRALTQSRDDQQRRDDNKRGQ